MHGTHTHAFVTFHFTQESVLLDFLGVRTWLTHSDTRSMTNMEFSGAGHVRVELRTHVVLCVLLLFGYGIAHAFPCFLGLRDWGQRSHRTRV